MGWFNLKSFNIAEYEKREKIENGDFNWIIPGKFLAFSNPSNANDDHYGYYCYTPEDYVPIFKKLGITGVIRLNNQTYDEKRFTRRGIAHYDLFFTDGSCPSKHIIR
jgi:cell division cycle 14